MSKDELRRIIRAAQLLAALGAIFLMAAGASDANVYATNLQAGGQTNGAIDVAGSGTVTLSFILNEPADVGVTLKIYRASDNVLIRTVNLGPLGKGTQSYVWDGKDQGGVTVPAGTSYYFTVEASDDGHTEWTQISDDTFQPSPGVYTNKFWSPRGVDVNKNPASRYFGRIYVVEPVGGPTASPVRTTTEGLYLLNADSTDAVGQGNTGKTGGVAWATTNSPFRVTVGPDGLVYVADWSDAHGGVWVGDPNFDTAQAILDNAGAQTCGLTANHGSVSAVEVRGIGANRVLYEFDEDWPACPAVARNGSILKFEIGSAPLPWTGPPGYLYDDNFPINRIQNYYDDFAIDSAGNIYMSQDRADGTDIASILKLDSGQNLLFHSLVALGGQDPLRNTRGLALDEARNRLAAATYNAGRVNIINSNTMDARTMEFLGPVVAVAVGDGGTIVRAIRSMTTGWSVGTPTSGTTNNLKSVYFQSGFTGLIAGEHGTVLMSTDSGATWTPKTPPADVTLNSVFSYAATTTGGTMWVVGDGGAAYKSTDGGTSWTAMNTGTTENLRSIVFAFASSSIGYLAGSNNVLKKTTDGGTTWTNLFPPVSANWNSIGVARHRTGAANDHVYVVGDGGVIIKSTDAGATWTIQTSGTTDNIVSVNVITSLIVVAATSTGDILWTTDGGAVWNLASASSALTAVRFVDPAMGWATGPSGTLLQTRDGGDTWTTVATGVTANLNSVGAGVASGGSCRDVAFDAVGNIYAVDNNLETLRIYSPPDGPNSYTTTSPGRIFATSGDLTPPSTVTVTDDGSVQLSSTTLHATWTAASDPETGVASYEYAVTDVPYDMGYGYVKPWTNVGNTLSATATGLSLLTGNQYYMLVRAINGAGIIGDSAISDGILVIQGTKIGDAKGLADGTLIGLIDVVATQDFTVIDNSFFYVEEQDRSAGIKCVYTGGFPPLGQKVDIVGRVKIADEMYIQVDNWTDKGTMTPPLDPVGMTCKTLGGGPMGNQQGVSQGIGSNNIGLLVKVWGEVKQDLVSDPEGYYFTIADGSTNDDGTLREVRCLWSGTPEGPTLGQYVTVTGISSLRVELGEVHRMIRMISWEPAPSTPPSP